MYILYICNAYIYIYVCVCVCVCVYMFYIYQCKMDYDKLLNNAMYYLV